TRAGWVTLSHVRPWLSVDWALLGSNQRPPACKESLKSCLVGTETLTSHHLTEIGSPLQARAEALFGMRGLAENPQVRSVARKPRGRNLEPATPCLCGGWPARTPAVFAGRQGICQPRRATTASRVCLSPYLLTYIDFAKQSG